MAVTSLWRPALVSRLGNPSGGSGAPGSGFAVLRLHPREQNAGLEKSLGVDSALAWNACCRFVFGASQAGSLANVVELELVVVYSKPNIQTS